MAVESVPVDFLYGRDSARAASGWCAQPRLSVPCLALGLVPPHGTDKARARDCTVRGDGGEKQKVAGKSYSSAHKIDGLLRGALAIPL